MKWYTRSDKVTKVNVSKNMATGGKRDRTERKHGQETAMRKGKGSCPERDTEFPRPLLQSSVNGQAEVISARIAR